MNKNIKKYEVKKMFGDNLSVEDAVILRNYLIEDMKQGKDIISIDLDGVIKVAPNYYSTLLTPILSLFDKNEVYAKLSFFNIKNKPSFNRAYYGTFDLLK